jgi:CRP-like cAMP-binding protein
MSVKTNYLGNILGHDPDALLALREVPAFHECSGPLLELLFRYGKIVQLREGEVLTREGDFDQWVFFIIDGRLGVYLGDQHVDTITSALVGERCILGEPRRATLRAAEEGVTALGLDMALLDALRDHASTVREPIPVYLELLSIIGGEVVNRIAELEFNLIDFAYRYRTHERADRISTIIGELAEGAYRADRVTNFTLYRYLTRHEPVKLQRCAGADGYTVDTARLYADAVLEGDHALLYRLAEAVQAQREADAGRAAAQGAEHGDENRYAAFARHFAQLVAAQRGGPAGAADGVQALAEGIRRRLRLDGQLKVDLRGLMAWLIAEHRFTAEDTIELLMLLLKEATDYTARINARIKHMVHELTQTHFVRQLESAALGRGMSPAEYYRSTPVEELIPFFSKNILDVYLVQPYLERVHSAATGVWERQPAGPEEQGRLITTLFE